jgi:hypothetical protein
VRRSSASERMDFGDVPEYGVMIEAGGGRILGDLARKRDRAAGVSHSPMADKGAGQKWAPGPVWWTARGGGQGGMVLGGIKHWCIPQPNGGQGCWSRGGHQVLLYEQVTFGPVDGQPYAAMWWARKAILPC